MKMARLPDGTMVPALGQGTWMMAERRGERAREIDSLRTGLDLGLSLIDTAEMYADGRAEELVGEAIDTRRDEVFLVSKVYPHHADRRGIAAACERSLRRLRTDRLDLYLLHWRGSVPLAETLEGFLALRRAGKIRRFGLSNFDAADLREWLALGPEAPVATNQVLYNLGRRGVEWDLLKLMREHAMPVMAYSPIEQARLLANAGLVAFARHRAITPAQAALAWLLSRDDAIVIPKSARADRVTENARALTIRFSASELAELDAIFPPPAGPSALAML